MESKVCTMCELLLPLDNFTTDKKGKFGRASKCKTCRRVIDAEYRKNNVDKETQRMQKWRKSNPKKAKEASADYRIKNIDKLKQQALDRQKEYRKDPIYRLKECVRTNIRNSLSRNGITKTSKTTQILGCSFDEFKIYIESQFEDWMSWDNRGLYNGELNHGWDLDHITPVSSAKTIEDFIKLNHYTNFQPLCSYINRDIKRDNY
jgi:hypothetical protein